MKCYASDYCQKDKSSCSDVCGGYRVLRALIQFKPGSQRDTVMLLLLSQKMERIWRRLQCWIIIKMMCSVW